MVNRAPQNLYLSTILPDRSLAIRTQFCGASSTATYFALRDDEMLGLPREPRHDYLHRPPNVRITD